MHILQDFIPDFTQKVTTGMICNRKSSIQCFEGLCYISLFNKVNIWNLKTQELLSSVGNRKHVISTFLIQKNYIFIGYEDGTVEIIKDFSIDFTSSLISKIHKAHTKKVSRIVTSDNFLISSSMDGTICFYDLLLEEIRYYFSGNNAAVESIFISNQSKLLAACSDKTIKVWDVQNENLIDAFAFDDDVFDVISNGLESFVCLKNGKSFIINLETKEKKAFEQFKNIRNIKLRDSTLYIQCQRKMITFQISKELSLGLVVKQRLSSSPEFVNFDVNGDKICFISRENKIYNEDKPIDFGFHCSDILDIKTDHSKIYSLSSDRIICWNKSVENPLKQLGKTEEFDTDEFTKENLELFFSIDVLNATCFEIFANFLIIGTSEGLVLIDRKFNEIKETLYLGKIASISASDSYLAVSVADKVIFYDKQFQEINTLSTPENVIYSLLLNDCFICSCFDNKIYQFTWPSLEIKITLYGHALPVRSFSVSSDQKLLVSCGADKLVKLWGLEFGDCRKSFVGDCRNVRFLNETLFMFGDKQLQYFNYFEKLKCYKIFNPELICPGTDYLIASSDRGLALLTMNKYEYVKEEESSEMEQLAIKNIASVRDYDSFLDHIQRLEESFNDSNIKMLFHFLEKMDFNELKKYLYVLDHISISILLRFIDMSKDKNSIVLFRLFSQLFKLHKDACLENELFENIRQSLLEKATELRDLYNLNQVRLEIEVNEFENNL